MFVTRVRRDRVGDERPGVLTLPKNNLLFIVLNLSGMVNSTKMMTADGKASYHISKPSDGKKTGKKTEREGNRTRYSTTYRSALSRENDLGTSGTPGDKRATFANRTHGAAVAEQL